MSRPQDNVNVRIEGRNTTEIDQNVQSPLDDSICHSVATIQSIPRDYIISEDLLAGQRLDGRMSNVRRFFCLFVTFDFLFSGLMWTICVMLKGEYLIKALTEQIVHYNVHTSLFDVVFASFCRFTVLLIFYAAIYINHWVVIAFSTALTSIFLAAKVVLYDWPHSSQPVFEVLLVLTSFVLSWGEAWFLDYRVIPQETFANRFLINNVEPERAPLINRYRQGLPSIYSESIGHFHSPFNTPNGSLYGNDLEYDRRPPLTREEEEKYKRLAATTLEEAYNTFQLHDWKLVKEINGDKVYKRDDSVHGRMHKITAQLDASPQFVMEELFFRINDFPKWSTMVSESYKIQTIDEHTDICYQRSSPAAGGMVSAREFVNIRRWKKIDDKYVIVFAKTEHPSVPINKECIRAENGVGCWVMEPLEFSRNKCIFHWMLHSKLNISLPKFMLEKELVKMMFNYVKDFRQTIEARG